MFSSWFSTPKKTVYLTLQPDNSGMKYAGFYDGTALKLVGTEGETINDFMRRFNTYRGPEEQIYKLFHADGSLLMFKTHVYEDMIAIVKHD